MNKHNIKSIIEKFIQNTSLTINQQKYIIIKKLIIAYDIVV